MRVSRGFFFVALTMFFIISAEVRASDEAFIQGAKKEGALVIYTSMTVDQAQKLNDAFKARYPFIQPAMFRAVGERLLTKIMTEAQAGKYDFDVVQSAETQAYFLKRKKLACQVCFARSEKYPKTVLRSRRILGGGLHDAERDRLQHAPGQAQRGARSPMKNCCIRNGRARSAWIIPSPNGFPGRSNAWETKKAWPT